MSGEGTVLERLARLEQRVATLNPVGPVAERDHEKGVRLRLGGTDEKPLLSPWIQPPDRSGASRYVPEIGEQQMVLANGGDWTQATLMPLTHSKAKPNPASDIDETVHHNRDGQRHAVKQGHVTDHAADKVTRGTGGKASDLKAGSGGGGGNVPHELNRQLQGMRAALTQHDQQIAGLHDVTSQMRAIAQGRIPELASLIPVLNGDPQSLKAAADGVLGRLQNYVASTMREMVGKLTNGFMDNVMGIVGSAVNGEIGAIIAQAQGLAAGTPAAGPLADAAALAAGGANANSGALGAKLEAAAASVAGTGTADALAPLLAQARGALGAAGAMFAGLGDMTDSQKNLTKGMTKQYRLGGY